MGDRTAPDEGDILKSDHALFLVDSSILRRGNIDADEERNHLLCSVDATFHSDHHAC